MDVLYFFPMNVPIGLVGRVVLYIDAHTIFEALFEPHFFVIMASYYMYVWTMFFMQFRWCFFEKQVIRDLVDHSL